MLYKYFEQLIKNKPNFILENELSKNEKLDIYIHIMDSLERLGLLISENFIEEKILQKYADGLYREIDVVSSFDYRVYLKTKKYTFAFLEKMIKASEEVESYETAHNFKRVLVLLEKKYQ